MKYLNKNYYNIPDFLQAFLDSKHNLCKIFFLLAATLFLSSCAFVPKEEAGLQYVYDMYGLDYNKGDKFYLNNCLWYEEPMNINTINYLKGKFIPVGEEVKFIKSFPGYIIFKTLKDNKTYKIINDSTHTLLSDKVQFHRLFSTENPLEKINATSNALELIKKGKVVKGMTKEQVRHTYGLPPRMFNPPEAKTTWVYFLDKLYFARHVIFKNDKVTFIFDC